MRDSAFARPVFFFAVALLVSGCASRSRPEARGETPPSPLAVVKEGAAVFFGGRIQAKVTLTPAMRPRLTGERIAGSDSGRRPSGPPPGGRGTPPGGGGRGGDTDLARPSGGPGGMREASMPPARITLTLTNQGDAAVDVEIAAFDSALGNFAVRPQRLRLEPGVPAEPDSMTSRLGVSSEDIPIAITLIEGTRRDTQTVIIRNLAPASAAQ